MEQFFSMLMVKSVRTIVHNIANWRLQKGFLSIGERINCWLRKILIPDGISSVDVDWSIQKSVQQLHRRIHKHYFSRLESIEIGMRTPTTVSLATTNYIDCLPCTAAAVAGQIVSVCFARIQKEQMFPLLSMSPAVDLLAASRFVNITHGGGASVSVAGAMTASLAANRLSTMVVVGRLACWPICQLLVQLILVSVHRSVGRSVGWSVGRLTKPEYTGKQVEKLFLSSDEAVFIQLICSKPSYRHASCSLHAVNAKRGTDPASAEHCQTQQRIILLHFRICGTCSGQIILPQQNYLPEFYPESTLATIILSAY
ncbi:putative protein TFG [Trichinella spiralis]|uniref:putative protein TFG n=1 Tax=Trichinella spiralis TaxID=6334 RepID=UPI0001EFF03C|nr:putative protein TFG [Trichinella spiralis]